MTWAQKQPRTARRALPGTARAAAGLLQELWRDKAGFTGIVLIAALVFMALAAPLIAPHDPSAQDLRARLMPPVWDEKGSWNHLLGTDHLGRDVLSRVIYGSRVSLRGASVVLLAPEPSGW